MKRIILIIALVSVILAGFSLDGIIEYSYRQSADQIESIEILRYVRNDSVQVGAPMYVVKTFKPDEFQMVLDGLNYLPVMNTLRSPGRGFGVYVICITYKNGEADILGDCNTGYITADGEVHQERYFVKRESCYGFTSSLMGEEITDYTLG